MSAALHSWLSPLCALIYLGLLAALHRSRMQQVGAYARARLEERLAERERIARDLHDTLLQGAQGLILHLQAANDCIPPTEPARELMERALERAERLMAESRDRIKNLRAPMSSSTELMQALAVEAEQLSPAHPAQFRASMEGAPRKLHPIVREEALLFAREALSNAFQHADASRIEAEVSCRRYEFRVRVWDNGKGIDRALLDGGAPVGHWGLSGMRERASMLGAHLDIRSTRETGTTIDLWVPASVAYCHPRPARQHARWWSKPDLFGELL